MARTQISELKSRQRDIQELRDRHLKLLRESATLSSEAASLQREALGNYLQKTAPLVAQAKQLKLEAEHLMSEIATRPEAAREVSEKSRQANALYREVSDIYRNQKPPEAARDLTSQAKAIGEEAEKLKNSPQFEKLSECVADQQRAARESIDAYRAVSGIEQAADST